MLYNISVPSFLRKRDDTLCNTCRYRNMDDDEIPCWDCTEGGRGLFDDDSGRVFMDRCREYLTAFSDIISQEDRTAQIPHVANVIFHDFALDDVNGWILLLEYNARCQPPLSPETLQLRMQQSIDEPPTDRPRGTLRDQFVAEICGDDDDDDDDEYVFLNTNEM